MELQDFTRSMIKQAKVSETLEKGLHWAFSKPLKASRSGSHAKQAKKVLSQVGHKLDNKTHDTLTWVAGGGKHNSINARKVINDTSRAHNLREFSATKPILAASAVGGTAIAMRRPKKESQPNLRLPDRSPQLTQDPSRVMYS